MSALVAVVSTFEGLIGWIFDVGGFLADVVLSLAVLGRLLNGY